MQICEFQFINSGIDQSMAYKGTYNPYLVILSVMIASMAGYVALKIVDRIKQTSTSEGKRAWGIVGAIAMGIGIWSMHFTGMIAFSLPVEIYYDPIVTLISVVPGIIASAIAIYFLNAEKISFWRLNLGGVLLGVGIGTMHYTGMAAMLTDATMMYYDPVFFALSVLVAHILATFALFVKFAPRQTKRFPTEITTVISAFIMGCAIVSMHYTGMKAALFLPDLEMTINQEAMAGLIKSGGLVFFIILGAIIIMGITVGSTFVDRYFLKLQRAIDKLNDEIKERELSEKSLHKSLQETKDIKFSLDEHAIVAITNVRGKITYINDKFCEISKYSRDELMGQDHRIISSGYHSKEFIRDLWRTIIAGKVWKGQIKNKSKDGSFYWVDTSIIPLLDKEGKPERYIAIRTEITERKKMESELDASNQQLKAYNQQLTAANEEIKKSKSQLEKKLYELERFQKITIGRELEMVKLKKRINGFLGELGKPKEYREAGNVGK